MTMLVKDPNPPPDHYGHDPRNRSIDDLLKCGIIILDKPKGPTSHQVTAWVRDMMGVSKAGHGGTLDPNVSGVLPIALGSAVKATDLVLSSDKEYVCLMRLHRDRSESRVRDMLATFVGRIYQFPPARSAIKRQLRVRRIHSIDVLQVRERDVLFRVTCDAGTYVRTLCVDVGEALGCGAHMEELRRTRSGVSNEADAHTLHEVRDSWCFYKEGDESWFRSILQPIEVLFEPMPKVILKTTAVEAICHGADLMAPGVARLDDTIRRNTLVALMTERGEAVAIGRAIMSAEAMMATDSGAVVDTDRVIMAKGTYPRCWTRPEQ